MTRANHAALHQPRRERKHARRVPVFVPHTSGSLKSIRDLIGALFSTYDDVSYWMPLADRLVVTMKDGRKLNVTIVEISPANPKAGKR